MPSATSNPKNKNWEIRIFVFAFIISTHISDLIMQFWLTLEIGDSSVVILIDDQSHYLYFKSINKSKSSLSRLVSPDISTTAILNLKLIFNHI